VKLLYARGKKKEINEIPKECVNNKIENIAGSV
jgi:hypothetical protein